MLSVSGCGAGPSTGGIVSPTPGSPSAAPVSCNLPLTVDPYQGFQIGVPDGWDVIRLGGTIFVTKDPASTEAAAVLPTLMTAGMTAASYFQTALTTLQQQLAGANLTLSSRDTSSGARPAASLSIQSGSSALSGNAEVAVLPITTAYGGSIVALIAYWAPQDRFADDSATLAGIGACYAPHAGTLYRVVKDQVFTYAIPVGWQVANEDKDSIVITQDGDATLRYDALGAISDSGVNSPQTLFTWATNKLGISVGQIVGTSNSPSTTSPTGALTQSGTVEFIGAINGQAIHGFALLLTTSAPGFESSGILRLGFATATKWNALNGALIHMAGSIQHDFTQDLLEWERLSRQSAAFAQQVQGFDYALTGVDLVHDPTTGATFEAPYAAWSRTGPAGPGYYSPAGNKLDIQTP